MLQKLKVYKTKWFMRYARQQDIDDSQLCKATETAEDGLIDADLGGGVIKQRLPRLNQGKSPGFRTIILFRSGDKAFFVYGYSKNDLNNIRKDELTAFKQLAIEMLITTPKELP
jgi:hypothetical protein